MVKGEGKATQKKAVDVTLGSTKFECAEMYEVRWCDTQQDSEKSDKVYSFPRKCKVKNLARTFWKEHLLYGGG